MLEQLKFKQIQVIILKPSNPCNKTSYKTKLLYIVNINYIFDKQILLGEIG